MGGQALLPHLDRRGVRGPAAGRRTLHRGDALRPPQPLFGVESLVGPFRQGVPRHLRAADGSHQLLEQLRSLPVSRKAHPAVHQQHSSRQTAAGLRPGRKCPRLALRRGPRPGHRHDLPPGPRRRNLQHRGIQRVAQHRPDTGRHPGHRPPAGASRGGFEEADHLRRRPRGARSALRHRLAQTQRGIRLGTLAAIRGGDRKDRSLVSRQPTMDGRHHLGRV